MATMTAQILIGNAHPYDGGIIPNYCMFLSENSVARWNLIPFNDRSQVWDKPIASWIPTIEFMLEDALMMIGLYVLKDKVLVHMAEECFQGKLPAETSLYENIDSKSLERMRERTRQLEQQYKIAISVFYGSTIKKQIQVLENYKMDVEVCMPIYRREFSVWNNEVRKEGSLEQLTLLFD